MTRIKELFVSTEAQIDHRIQEGDESNLSLEESDISLEKVNEVEATLTEEKKKEIDAMLEKLNQIDKQLEPAVKLPVGDPHSYLRQGNYYIITKNYEKAIEEFKKALKIASQDKKVIKWAWNNMGSAYGEKGERKKAVEYHKKAIDIDPEYAVAWYNMGTTYGRLVFRKSGRNRS